MGSRGSGRYPTTPSGRMEWTDRAGTVAAYREAFAVEGSDPIGAVPPAARPEARGWWNAANQALAGEQPATSRATDGGAGGPGRGRRPGRDGAARTGQRSSRRR